MNLSLPFFDLPAGAGPAQTRAGPAVRRRGAAAGMAPGAQADLLAAPGTDPGSLAPGGEWDGRPGKGSEAANEAANEAASEAASDAAASAATDPLAGSGFEAALGAVARASRLAELHPSLWRASQIGGAAQRCTASGFAALDAQLPGGGWPHGALTELLLPQAGVGELRLLAPALASMADRQASKRLAGPGPAASPPADEGRCVMLFDPPAGLSAWALVQCGLDSRHWLVVQARAGQGAAPHGAPRRANRLSPLLASADLLWALEQSLKSGHVGTILAWLPLHLRADALRRLQIAAQAHDGPVFVLRDAQARSQPSPAPLRLLLQPAGVDGLSVRLLKRRGPPLAQPLRLALPSVLTSHQQAQAQARDLTRQAARALRDDVQMR